MGAAFRVAAPSPAPGRPDADGVEKAPQPSAGQVSGPVHGSSSLQVSDSGMRTIRAGVVARRKFACSEFSLPTRG